MTGELHAVRERMRITAAVTCAILATSAYARHGDIGVQPVDAVRQSESALFHAAHQAGDQAANGTAREVTVATLIGVNPAPEKAVSDIDLAQSHLAKKQFDQALEVAQRLIRANPNDVTGYRVQAAAYAGKQDFANARKSYEKALSISPDDAETLAKLGELDIRQRDFGAARKRYEAMLAKDPASVAAMIGMANVEASNNKDRESVAWLEKAKAAKPEALAPRIDLALYHFRKRDYMVALAELDEAQRLHPDNPGVLNLIAQIQVANGQLGQAVATYKKLVSLTPDAPRAWYGLALAQVKNGNTSDAAESLRKAIQLKPDYVEAVDALAGLEFRAGRSAEAMKLAKDLQKTAPASPAGITLEGDLLMLQRRYADATKAYGSAFAMQPTGLAAVKLHAAETKAGNTKEADAKLQQWLKDHPDDVGAWQYSAMSNLQAGRDKVAIEQYERVLQKLPNDLMALNNLAILYQREMNPRAVAMAERAYKLKPDSPSVNDTLGWILIEQGNAARGIEFVKRAAEAAPKNAEIRYHLAVAYAKSGAKDQARKELEGLLAGKQAFPQRAAAELLLKQL
jgi:putative PEP-CTERM system TPR-repeat lipoprotein